MALPNNINGFDLASVTDGASVIYDPNRYVGVSALVVVNNDASGTVASDNAIAGTETKNVIAGHGNALLVFDLQLPAVAGGLPTVGDPLDFNPTRSGGTILLTFAVALRSLAATTVTGNYTVTGPTVITVTSITFTPGNAFLALNYTGTLSSGIYTVTLAASTVMASANVAVNTLVGQSLVVAGAGGGSHFNTGFN